MIQSLDNVSAFDDQRNQRFNGSLNWMKASDNAVGIYTFASKEEWDWLGLIQDRSIWIGASDIEKEGTWRWVTGEPFSWKRWALISR